MYNLRYHVASLVAVFLALAVGLILGSVVAERGTLEQQSSRLVEDLQRRFDAIQQDNAVLKQGLERDRTFASDVVPVLTDGMLDGMTVGVIANEGRCDGLSASIEAIEAAGGTAVVFTMREAAFGLPDEVPASLADTDGARSTERALIDELARRFVAEWGSLGERPLTRDLLDGGMLAVEGERDMSAIDAWVTLASFAGAPDAVGVAVCAKANEMGLGACGVQATTTDTGVARAAADTDVNAVDHIESPAGAFSLVAVLCGRASGAFGVMPYADRVYPDVRRVVEGR